MMLNDVALDEIVICKSGMDNNYSVIISMPGYLIKDLQEIAFTEYKDLRYCNGIISNLVSDYVSKQHQTASLSIEGKKPRKDVLKKLKSLADYLETLQSFPMLNRKTIENAIISVFGPLDSRTANKYMNFITAYVKTKTGKPVSYYSVCDLTGLKETVISELTNLTK